MSQTLRHLARPSTRAPRTRDPHAEVVYAAHTRAIAERLLPFVVREFGDTPALQAGRRAVLARDSTRPRRRNP